MKSKQAVLSLLCVALFSGLAGWLAASAVDGVSLPWAVTAGAAGATVGVLISFNPLLRNLVGLSDEPLLGGAARTVTGLGPFDRNELVALILGQAGLVEASRRVRFSPVELSFRGAADYILAEGLAAGGADERRRHALALAGLYSYHMISDDSLAIIRRAVLRLSDPPPVDLDSLRETTFDEWSSPIELRDALDRLSSTAAGG
ncbi:MAG: hypothetical protein PVG07_01135 [Acidobacteriota bacterium]|jgi:hypothetical protein